ncbi:MAG: TlpA family protein disulfide reductase [Planctomycetes bacterium]|nr:TlpA family protein disulfide reductase [Planctomycetota bacterium]
MNHVRRRPSVIRSFARAARRFARCAVLIALAMPRGATGQPPVFVPAPKISPSTSPPDADRSITVPVARVESGGGIPGSLCPIAEPDRIAWRSPLFEEPFVFPIGAITAVEFPSPAPVKPSGEFCAVLTAGDLVFGSIRDFNETRFTIDSPRLGRLAFSRERLVRLTRWNDGSSVVFQGPNGLGAWRHEFDDSRWYEEQSGIAAQHPGASIFGDVSLPAQARIELELSWNGQPWQAKPDFVVEFGASPDREERAAPFTLEVWEGKLVAQRETERDGDVRVVDGLEDGAGRVALEIFLDQSQGRMLVYNASGAKRAELTVPDSAAGPTGMRMTNLSGNVRLNRLIIARWNGTAPPESPGTASQIRRASGQYLDGSVRGYDPASKAWVVHREGGREDRVPAEDLDAISFGPNDQQTPVEGAVSIACQDGTRVTGALLGVSETEVRIRCAGSTEIVPLPLDGVRMIQRVAPADTRSEAKVARAARLEHDGWSTRGDLRDTPDGADGLAWQPIGSLTTARMRPDGACRIVFREHPAASDPYEGIADQETGVTGFFHRLFRSSGPTGSGPPATRLAIHLRSGDCIPCSEIALIDAERVRFRSELVEATQVPVGDLQAVILGPSHRPSHGDASDPLDGRPDGNPFDDSFGASPEAESAKLARLLTVPRLQRRNPPTHLIVSQAGDYLRGRLIGMDVRGVSIELRLETTLIPRDRIAGIYWLRPDADGGTYAGDSQDASVSSPSAHSKTAGPRVHAVRADGTRMTFDSARVHADVLHGASPRLGACRIELPLIDELVVGAAIEEAAARLPVQQWKLTSAPDPSTLVAEGQTPRLAGTDSDLVGRPAPSFELARLDGAPFRLADERGKIIVLDFWATWCGPCIRAMPVVEEVVGRFADRDVRLYAVNLQETPEKISAFLERRRLNPTVLLDRDGAVAAHYDAVAIPQTVIIDREGNIARLFVGGGPELGEQLRAALEAIAGTSTP